MKNIILNKAIDNDFKREIKSQIKAKDRGDNLINGRKKFKHIPKRVMTKFEKILDEYERPDGGVGFIVSYFAGGLVQKMEYTPEGSTVVVGWQKVDTGVL